MIAIRILAFPLVAAVVVAGVWLTGGVIADDFWVSMLLTGAWFGLAGAVSLLVALRSRPFRLPVLGAYVLTVAVVGGYLGLTTLRDDVVHEDVVVGVPAAAAAAAPPDGAPSATGSAAAAPAQPVELAHGRFRSHEHTTTGRAAVVRLPEGRRYLTLTGFETSPGPDLRVRLVPGDGFDGGVEAAVDLGALKGNRGDQQYRLPAGVRIGDHTVVVWCRAFSAPFGSARLQA